MLCIPKSQYRVPDFISPETFESLTWKERDFLVLVHSRKFTKSEIQRMLYIPSKTSYWRMRRKMTEIVRRELESGAVPKRNEMRISTCALVPTSGAFEANT